MRTDKYLYAFLLYLNIFIFTYSEENETKFIPTKEWQVIKKGMPLPAGLHIRYNMANGTLEAKLVDKEKKNVKTKNVYNSKSLMLHPDEEVTKTNDDAPVEEEDYVDYEVSLKEINDVVNKKKNGKTDDSEPSDVILDLKKFLKKKSYKLKVLEGKNQDVVIKTDDVLFNLLFNKFKKYKEKMHKELLLEKDISAVIEILNSLEYAIHQIDSGRLFVILGGLTEIIFPCLNSTYDSIKSEALRLLGAVAQSNPEVQNKAMEKGLVLKVLLMLGANTNSTVRNRCIFALGALIRNFPEAQKQFFEHGGIESFDRILQFNEENLELQYRVMRLINDMIVERQNIGKAATPMENNTENIIIADQYHATDFKNRLLMHKYCRSLIILMVYTIENELVDQTKIDNYELLELLTESMIRISAVCRKEFRRKAYKIREYLNRLINFYERIGRSIESTEIRLINDLIFMTEKLLIIIEVPLLHDEL